MAWYYGKAPDPDTYVVDGLGRVPIDVGVLCRADSVYIDGQQYLPPAPTADCGHVHSNGLPSLCMIYGQARALPVLACVRCEAEGVRVVQAGKPTGKWL